MAFCLAIIHPSPTLFTSYELLASFGMYFKQFKPSSSIFWVLMMGGRWNVVLVSEGFFFSPIYFRGKSHWMASRLKLWHQSPDHPSTGLLVLSFSSPRHPSTFWWKHDSCSPFSMYPQPIGRGNASARVQNWRSLLEQWHPAQDPFLCSRSSPSLSLFLVFLISKILKKPHLLQYLTLSLNRRYHFTMVFLPPAYMLKLPFGM